MNLLKETKIEERDKSEEDKKEIGDQEEELDEAEINSAIKRIEKSCGNRWNSDGGMEICRCRVKEGIGRTAKDDLEKEYDFEAK